MGYKPAIVQQGEESFVVWFNYNQNIFMKHIRIYEEANLPCDVEVFCGFIMALNHLQSILFLPDEEYPVRYMVLSDKAYYALKPFFNEYFSKSD